MLAHIQKITLDLIKFVVIIWNHGKNLQELRGQKHCKNVGLHGVTLGHLS